MLFRLMLLINCLIFLYPFEQALANNLDETKTLMIEATGKSIENVIDIIADQSGYHIKVSEDLLEFEVKGSYQSNDIEKLFQRLLRGYNVFQIIDTEKKELLIYTNLRNNQPVYSSNPAKNEGGVEKSITTINLADIEIFPGTSLADVRRSQAENTRKLNNEEIDIIMEGDISLTEVRKQISQNQKDIDDGVIEVEIFPGYTLKEVQQSNKEYLLTHNVNDLLVGESDITIKELNAMQAKNEVKVRSGEIDIGIVDGVPGIGY